MTSLIAGTRKVLYSPDFGAGWSTWNTEYAEDFLFDAALIAAVETREDLGDEEDPASPLGMFVERLVAKHGEDARHVYLGGSRSLRVQTVEGRVRVEEYDGAESVITMETDGWF